ncbi:general secretion pathway protein M [Luteimonas cucumeris]|uniref:General secretion pathway protein M n=1 Tax=Luteimonas cucumeris TaxID=985012 RepID=A0A562LBK2_9GAMM|nr:type II secretion system protein GspM [Luteimonas cucumeris]TWI05052.1 general secretion pathway protein M [Luteimonas cucumeris]
MRNPRADRDRWLALGLLLAALALAYLLLVHPWWTVPMLEAQGRIDDLQQRELRMRMQLQQQPEIQRRLQANRQQDAQRPGFLPEASAELATSGLVQQLEQVVQEASPGNRGCQISNRSPLTVASNERFRKIVVQVRLRCGMPELSKVLYQLENRSPRMFVEDLNILSQANYFVGDASRAQQGGLDVSFNLYGFLKPTTGVPGAR